MSRTLKIAQLKGACADQRALFRKTFGASVEVTEALAIEHAALFDWAWAAENLLSAPARAEYDKACAPAWAKYDKACAPAWAEYVKACAPALAEYEKVRAPAWAEYEKVRAAARAEYDKACAPAWAMAYIADGASA